MAPPLIGITAGNYVVPDGFLYNRAYSFNAILVAKADEVPVTIADLDDALYHRWDGFLIPVLFIPFCVSIIL